MRKFCLLVSLCIASLVSAQDVIVLKDGSTILGKNLEVGTSEVKYQRWIGQDKNVYTVNISNITSINYQNGEVETFASQTNSNAFTPTARTYSPKETTVTLKSGASSSEWRLSEKQNVFIGTAVGLALTGAAWTTAVLLSMNESIGTGGFLLIGLGGTFASIYVGDAITNSLNNKMYAVESYNLYRYEHKLGNSILSSELNILADNYSQECTLGIGLRYCF